MVTDEEVSFKEIKEIVDRAQEQAIEPLV